jgi:hypothetical protein|tara:strand:- start:423 stop:1358 length:936 start_codon:yes stop_codon:yes gene_type:complete
MDEFDKQVRKDAMAGFSNTKVTKNKKAINRTTKKINKNLIDDVIKPLAGKTPPGRVIKTFSKIGKNIKKKIDKFDEKDSGLYAIAGLPVVVGAVETLKSLKNRKSKKQQELGTIEYGFDTKAVDPVKKDNIGRYIDKNFRAAKTARIQRRQTGGSSFSIQGKDAALDMYDSFVGPDADKLSKAEKAALVGSKARREIINKDKSRRQRLTDIKQSKYRNRRPFADLTPGGPSKMIRRMQEKPEPFTPYAEDFNKGGFGALSVEAGIDNNYNPTHADRIAVGKLKEKGKGMRTGGICRGIGKAIKGTGFSGVK